MQSSSKLPMHTLLFAFFVLLLKSYTFSDITVHFI